MFAVCSRQRGWLEEQDALIHIADALEAILAEIRQFRDEAGVLPPANKKRVLKWPPSAISAMLSTRGDQCPAEPQRRVKGTSR